MSIAYGRAPGTARIPTIPDDGARRMFALTPPGYPRRMTIGSAIILIAAGAIAYTFGLAGGGRRRSDEDLTPS